MTTQSKKGECQVLVLTEALKNNWKTNPVEIQKLQTKRLLDDGFASFESSLPLLPPLLPFEQKNAPCTTCPV